MTVALPQRRVPLGLDPGQSVPRLCERVVEVLRGHHDAQRTEHASLHWIRRYLEFPSDRQPRELAETELNRFLTHWVVEDHVSASAQNHAFSAILFLYDRGLEQPLNRLAGVVRAKRPKRLPVVLSPAKVAAVLSRLSGGPRLVATLHSVGGLRLLEARSGASRISNAPWAKW